LVCRAGRETISSRVFEGLADGAAVVEDVPRDAETPQEHGWGERVSSVSVDWWATVLAGVITALAVANVLPKIPW
jgi:hypothetical protein